MSLRHQLLGTFALVLLSTLIFAAWLTYRHALLKINTEMQAALAVGSRIAHNAVDDAEEVVNPRRRLELLVADFDGDRHLKAFIVEPDGGVKVQSKPSEEEQDVPGWFARLLDWKSETVKLNLPAVFNGYGEFVLQTDARNEIGETWSDISLFSQVLAFFCVGSVVAAHLILGRALTPLSALISAFHRIGAGDYAPRMPETGATEFAGLARGFNQMAGRLAEMEGKNTGLLKHLETVQEEERIELARNLHDDVSPLLFCIDVDAMSIRRQADASGDKAMLDRALSIQSAISDLKTNVKGILSDLRPSSLHALSLADAIDDLAEFWSSRHPSVRVEARCAAFAGNAKMDDAILAVVRESVSNAFKHGHPTSVLIDVGVEGGEVTVRVRDDGGGLTRPVTEGGFGILGMKERISKLGGRLSVGSAANGRGVEVVANIPKEAGRSAPAQSNIEAVQP